MKGYIVVEIGDVDNQELVELINPLLVEPFVPHDVIGRLMIQCARQEGLAAVYDKLLGYEGMEFYCVPWPELVGVQWQDVVGSFPDAIPLGILNYNNRYTHVCSGKMSPFKIN